MLVTVGVGSILRSVPYQRRPCPPSVVKYAFMPACSLLTSASDTCVCTVIVDRSAMRRMVGACWFVFSVWPCRAVMLTTVPDIGAKMRVNLRFASSTRMRGLQLLHLRLERSDLRFHAVERGLRVLHRAGRGRFFLHQVLLTLEIPLGLLEVRLALHELRLLRTQLGAARVDACDRSFRIDLGEQVAFLHLAAHLDHDALQLSRHLRAHIDVVARLQRARGGDEILDGALLHRRVDILVARAGRHEMPEQLPGAECEQHCEHGEYEAVPEQAGSPAAGTRLDTDSSVMEGMACSVALGDEAVTRSLRGD